MNFGYRGPNDRGGGLDRFLLGRRGDDLLGELRVVREEVTGQVRLGSREILVEGVRRVRQQRDGAALGGFQRDVRGSRIGLLVGPVLEEVQPRRQPRGGDQRGRHQDDADIAAGTAHHPTADAVACSQPSATFSSPESSATSPESSADFAGFGESRRLRCSPRGWARRRRALVLVGGHGTNSTFDILICPPSLCRFTDNRHARGSCLAPAALVTREVAATRTTAESGLIDSTAVALTVTSVITFDSCATLMKSSAWSSKSVLNCRSSCR